MKNFIAIVATILTLASCSGTSSISSRSILTREVISPGAPQNMPFRSDETTLRAYHELSDTNPISVTNRNIAHCKAAIASSAFNAIEDCCIEYVEGYQTKKAFIEHFSKDIIKESLNDAVVVYDKTTISNDKTYTSYITLELKKEKLLHNLKELFTENGIIDVADADALINSIDNAMLPKL